MNTSLTQIAKDALALPAKERIALAGLLLEAGDEDRYSSADEEWQAEIADRIQRIDSGLEVGIEFQEVMQAAARQIELVNAHRQD